MVGKVDGHADINIDLDGNGMLEHLDITCQGLPPSPLCPLLQDKTFTLPLIKATFDGTTYGVGATLAGGWKGWFFAVPLNWTYADMSDSNTDGVNFTATPGLVRHSALGVTVISHSLPAATISTRISLSMDLQKRRMDC